ncbi:MAG: hypothetical protein KDA81_03830 [Planctomycetaceae bacterium]|nr:hypothetical protein [Planctomycetaceae bacterium]
MQNCESDECSLLTKLRETPELFEQIRTSAEKELSSQEQLRRKFAPDLVRAAMVLVEARQKAASILPSADSLWLNRVGLEQATHWQVAHHKARRFSSVAEVYDLCSGIGVDSCALVQHSEVVSVDRDPAMGLRCQWNIEAWRQTGHSSTQFCHQTSVADVEDLPLEGRYVHADPDRRDGRDRPVKRLEQYRPNLEWMQNVIRTARGGAIKLGPASNFLQKFPGCEIELISYGGECREATVWFGELSGSHPFRATVLPSGESIHGDPLQANCPVAECCGEYLFDPDPAVVRSGLLDLAGEIGQMRRMDREDEYLTSDVCSANAFVTPYKVEAVLGGNPRELRKYLRQAPSSSYEVKCRRLKVDANALQKQLPRGECPPRVVLFARQNGKASIIVARRFDFRQNDASVHCDPRS